MVNIISICGLCFNVGGALLLVLKGLPPIHSVIKSSNPDEPQYQWELQDETDQDRMRKLYEKYEEYKKYLPWSIAMIIFGFVLQIVAEIIGI